MSKSSSSVNNPGFRFSGRPLCANQRRGRRCEEVAEWGSGGEFEGNPWGLMGSPPSKSPSAAAAAILMSQASFDPEALALAVRNFPRIYSRSSAADASLSTI